MRSAFQYLLLCIMFTIQAQQTDIKRVDEFALSLPDYFWSTKSLANAIEDSCYVDIDKIRALFVWMTHNITYNIKAFESGLKPSADPSITLGEGKALCYGYALLFDSVCHKMGIESYIILGYTKTNFNPRSSDHAWNSIKINDNWYFIDATWGSGRVENYQRKNILHKLFKKPGIKNASVFVREMNETYFMADAQTMAKTHLPADPMWQMREYPISLDCFLSDETSCSQDSFLFNFQDTLRHFARCREEEKMISTAKRANQFNPLNNYDLASAYINIGMDHFEVAERIVPQSVKQLKKEMEIASYHLNNGAFFLYKARHIDDSIYRARVFDFKKDYKSSARNLKNYRKGLLKTISRNTKYIDKLEKNKSKIKDIIGRYSESSQNIMIEEKIYLIDRPDELTEKEDSIIVEQSFYNIDSVKSLLITEKDTLYSFLSGSFEQLFDSIKTMRTTLNELMLVCNDFIHIFKEVYTENNQNTFDLTDSIFPVSDKYYETMLSYRAIIDKIIKRDLREYHSFVKYKLKSIETHVKYIKKQLITIKKHSLLSQKEEEIYENLNILLAEFYKMYVEKLEGELAFYKTEGVTLKGEKKTLKRNIKQIKKTEDLLSLYYRYNLDKKKIKYINEKQDVKAVSKAVSSAGNVCSRTLEK